MGTLARGYVGFAGEGTQPGLTYAIASTRVGLLLDVETNLDQASRERLEGLAATLPELFGTVDASCLDRVSERLGVPGVGQMFSELLLLSDDHLHLIQPLGKRPGTALLAVSPAAIAIGLALSEFHARVAALEDE